MNHVLLNFSGHALSEATKAELLTRFKSIEDVFFGNVDFSQNVERQLKRIVGEVKTRLDGSVPIAIIPPGHATLAVLITIFLHGLVGYFPVLCLLEAKAAGDYRPTNLFQIDGGDLRSEARKLRQEILTRKT